MGSGRLYRQGHDREGSFASRRYLQLVELVHSGSSEMSEERDGKRKHPALSSSIDSSSGSATFYFAQGSSAIEHYELLEQFGESLKAGSELEITAYAYASRQESSIAGERSRNIAGQLEKYDCMAKVKTEVIGKEEEREEKGRESRKESGRERDREKASSQQLAEYARVEVRVTKQGTGTSMASSKTGNFDKEVKDRTAELLRKAGWEMGFEEALQHAGAGVQRGYQDAVSRSDYKRASNTGKEAQGSLFGRALGAVSHAGSSSLMPESAELARILASAFRQAESANYGPGASSRSASESTKSGLERLVHSAEPLKGFGGGSIPNTASPKAGNRGTLEDRLKKLKSSSGINIILGGKAASTETVEGWIDVLENNDLKGKTWAGKLKSNGNREVIIYSSYNPDAKDAKKNEPSERREESSEEKKGPSGGKKKSLGITLIYDFHGNNGFSFAEKDSEGAKGSNEMNKRTGPQLKAMTERGTHFVYVKPKMGWAQGSNRSQRIRAYNQAVYGGGIDFAGLDKDVEAILQEQFGRPVTVKKRVRGHSAGGYAVRGAARSGGLREAGIDEVVLSEADYARKGQEYGSTGLAVYRHLLEHNPKAILHMLVQDRKRRSAHEPTKNAFWLKGRRKIKDDPRVVVKELGLSHSGIGEMSLEYDPSVPKNTKGSTKDTTAKVGRRTDTDRKDELIFAAAVPLPSTASADERRTPQGQYKRIDGGGRRGKGKQRAAEQEAQKGGRRKREPVPLAELVPKGKLHSAYNRKAQLAEYGLVVGHLGFSTLGTSPHDAAEVMAKIGEHFTDKSVVTLVYYVSDFTGLAEHDSGYGKKGGEIATKRADNLEKILAILHPNVKVERMPMGIKGDILPHYQKVEVQVKNPEGTLSFAQTQARRYDINVSWLSDKLLKGYKTGFTFDEALQVNGVYQEYMTLRERGCYEGVHELVSNLAKKLQSMPKLPDDRNKVFRAAGLALEIASSKSMVALEGKQYRGIPQFKRKRSGKIKRGIGKGIGGVRLENSRYVGERWRHPKNRFGVEELVDTLKMTTKELYEETTGTYTTVGHISKESGGHLEPHATHQTYTSVDIGVTKVSRPGRGRRRRRRRRGGRGHQRPPGRLTSILERICTTKKTMERGKEKTRCIKRNSRRDYISPGFKDPPALHANARLLIGFLKGPAEIDRVIFDEEGKKTLESHFAAMFGQEVWDYTFKPLFEYKERENPNKKTNPSGHFDHYHIDVLDPRKTWTRNPHMLVGEVANTPEEKAIAYLTYVWQTLKRGFNI